MRRSSCSTLYYGSYVGRWYKNRYASRMETGLLVYLIWKFVPMINNMTMYEATGVCADLVAFLFSLAAIIILSMFTQKTNEEEQKVFEQMRQSQR